MLDESLGNCSLIHSAAIYWVVTGFPVFQLLSLRELAAKKSVAVQEAFSEEVAFVRRPESERATSIKTWGTIAPGWENHWRGISK